MWKQFIASYFGFSKKERRGIFVLISLIMLFAFLPFAYPLLIKEKHYDQTKFTQESAKLKALQTQSREAFEEPNEFTYQPYQTQHNDVVVHAELFYFDPNTLSEDGWKKLGVKEKTIETIKKYIAKGGRFYKAEDIGKIWGLNKDLVGKLMPYIRIEPSFNNQLNNYKKEEYSYTNKPITRETNKPIDINTGDTSAFISLPGIGSKLSQRIITFRDKLGGFYKIEQVAETFGLPDSTFQKIRPLLMLNNNSILQFNINTATIDEMKTHPYFKYALANAIVQYRTQHGSYQSVEDIKKIMSINTETFNKIVPYLKVN